MTNIEDWGESALVREPGMSPVEAACWAVGLSFMVAVLGIVIGLAFAHGIPGHAVDEMSANCSPWNQLDDRYLPYPRICAIYEPDTGDVHPCVFVDIGSHPACEQSSWHGATRGHQ